MDGAKLLKEFERRITKERGTKSIADSALAKELGVTPAELALYRGKEITPRQAVNLMYSFAKRSERQVMGEAVISIVEFFHLDPVETKQGKGWQLFSTEGADGSAHPYLSGLRARLEKEHGVYVFHDSRGRAIYAGKAQQLSLWTEMNNAFNRHRGEVQNIKRVKHPSNKVQYKENNENKRQIGKESVALHHLASYMSAYRVPDGLIRNFEALIIRAFANDLLNVRMEKFRQST